MRDLGLSIDVNYREPKPFGSVRAICYTGFSAADPESRRCAGRRHALSKDAFEARREANDAELERCIRRVFLNHVLPWLDVSYISAAAVVAPPQPLQLMRPTRCYCCMCTVMSLLLQR